MSTASSAHSPTIWGQSARIHHHHPRVGHNRRIHSHTPLSRSSGTPPSVGQTMPPLVSNPPVSPSEARPPSPNYFGLRLDPVEGHGSSSAVHNRRAKWSSPSSNVRSTAALSPQVIPLDQNPEYESFRRQSEARECNIGWLPSYGTDKATPKTFEVRTPLERPGPKQKPSTPAARPSVKESGTQHQRSPKRLLSSDSSTFPRRASPASFIEKGLSGQNDDLRPSFADSGARHSLPSLDAPPMSTLANHRADTVPASMDEGLSEGPSLVTPQYVVSLLEASSEELLLLDTRVSTHFARSTLSGALNVCIPTTLLKRPSFNIQKLADTFKDSAQKESFERWRSCKYIIAYDGSSSQLKDAMTCVNTLKKFVNEGWEGSLYIIRGGFESFSKQFPSYIVQAPSSTPSPTSTSLKLDSVQSSVAPVAGGCPLPATSSAANPFFGNIRQNMDLIGGVGQMPVKQPASMTNQMKAELPLWLQKVVDEKDDGKLVSEKFLQIEKKEQKRMQEALSGNVTYGTPGSAAPKSVQVAGIEKGAKNRYNNIWPYEHSRVKLEDISGNGCDYVNANYIKAARSDKRYIATQGPIPDTFADFWNVVWQQDVRVIIMLTAEKENGQVKAHNYWDSTRYGSILLSFLSEHRASLEPAKIHKHSQRPANPTRRSTTLNTTKVSKEPASPAAEQPYITVRKFSLSHSEHPFERVREITQLQYSSWPDFGAPAHPAHLLGLVEQCNTVVRSIQAGRATVSDGSSQRPVLVHCSAGCGRTGTFCTVDSVIDMLKQQRRVRRARQGTPMDIDRQSQSSSNAFQSSQSASQSGEEDDRWLDRDDLDLIEKTVEEFRLQRLSMVQSLRQFVLCYESVLEWLVSQPPKSA